MHNQVEITNEACNNMNVLSKFSSLCKVRLLSQCKILLNIVQSFCNVNYMYILYFKDILHAFINQTGRFAFIYVDKCKLIISLWIEYCYFCKFWMMTLFFFTPKPRADVQHVYQYM